MLRLKPGDMMIQSLVDMLDRVEALRQEVNQVEDDLINLDSPAIWLDYGSPQMARETLEKVRINLLAREQILLSELRRWGF